MSIEVRYWDNAGAILPSGVTIETNGKFVSVTDVVRHVFNNRCGTINAKEHWALVYEKRPNCVTELLQDPQSFHTRMCNKDSKYTIEFHSNKDSNYEEVYFHVPAVDAPLVVRQRARSLSRRRVPSGGMKRKEDRRPSRSESRTRMTFAEPDETKEVERPAVINVLDLPSLPLTTPEPLPVEPEIRSMPPATPREPVFTTVPEPKAPLIRREKSPSPNPLSTVPLRVIAKQTNLEANECRIDIDTNICGSDGRTFTYVENFKIGPQSGPIKRRLVQLHNNKLNQCRKDGYNVLGAAFKMNWTTGTFELVENANSVLFEAGQTYRFKYDESREEQTPTPGWFPMQPSRPYPFSVTFRLVLPPHFEPWIQTTTLNLCRPYKVSQLIYHSKSYLRAPLSRMGSSVLNVAVYQTAPVKQELGFTDYFSEGSSFDIHFVANGVDYPMDSNYEEVYFHVPAVDASLVVRQRARSLSRRRVPSGGTEACRPSRSESRKRVTFAEPLGTEEDVQAPERSSVSPLSRESSSVESEVPSKKPKESVWTEPHCEPQRRTPSPETTHVLPSGDVTLKPDECLIVIETNILGTNGRPYTKTEPFEIGSKSCTVKKRLEHIHNNRIDKLRREDGYVIAAAMHLNKLTGQYAHVEWPERSFFHAGETYKLTYLESDRQPEFSHGWYHMRRSRQSVFHMNFKMVSPWGTKYQSKDLELNPPFKLWALINTVKSYLRVPLQEMCSPAVQVAVFYHGGEEIDLNDHVSPGSSLEIIFVSKQIAYPMPVTAFEINLENNIITPIQSVPNGPIAAFNSRPPQHLMDCQSAMANLSLRPHPFQRSTAQFITAPRYIPLSSLNQPQVPVRLSPPRAEPPTKEENLVNYSANPIREYIQPAHMAVLSLQCPRENCDQQTFRIWKCNTCYEVLRYGFDDHLYCHCGKLQPKFLTFRCSEHGNYVPYKEHLLLKKLRRTKIEKM
ncbi:hypothetical protein QR680_011213 [Steinernema hermaphroditum]|uniref:Uncharacterized protein n=1 Tax=Steinernema hermaphroditum TaxID=289476 RepID=A0AA39IRG1_9BILA|nr:hypothetical protein QR680_011213 [Steinernema hermaphroditum]